MPVFFCVLRMLCGEQFLNGKVSALIAMIVVCGVASGAESPQPTEYQVKAAFLYNFAKFVEWPAKALPEMSPFITLCVLGEDPFGDDLEQTVQGKNVSGRQLRIRRFQGLQDIEGCHILFVSTSERWRLPQILERLKQAHVLTVGEMEQFAKQGGIINFTVEENKIRFEINVDAAERAGLKISSKLLRLAKIIRD